MTLAVEPVADYLIARVAPGGNFGTITEWAHSCDHILALVPGRRQHSCSHYQFPHCLGFDIWCLLEFNGNGIREPCDKNQLN